ncbi:ribonuclease E/G [Jhaorihella thermophila]
MKGRTIILDEIRGRAAAALMVDGRLDDFLIEGDAPAPGTIYRARAERPMKGQGGLFLTTPDGTAFLRQVKGISPGSTMLVQVSGYAEPGKAMPVTTRLLFKSRYAIVTPAAPGINISRRIRDEAERDRLLEIAHAAMGGSAHGLILRSGCAGAADEEIAQDIADMLDLADRVLGDDGAEVEKLVDGDGPHALAWREWTDPAEVVTAPGGFAEHGVLEEIDRALGPREPLPGAGS